MRPATDLRKLDDAVRRRIYRIEGAYASLSEYGWDKQRIGLSYLVIELDNVLLLGMREFLISSCLRTRTCGGVRIETTVHLRNESEVGAFSLQTLNHNKFNRLGCPKSIAKTDEQGIYFPRDLQRVIFAAGASNLPTVDRAVAFNFSVFEEIRSVRNFYAHRNQFTFGKVQSLARRWGRTKIEHVDEISVMRRPGRPFSIIEEWVAEAREFFSELLK